MGETYHESAVTGEVVKESELIEVTVYGMETSGHNHFEKNRIGSAYVEKSKIGSNYADIEVLAAFNEPIMVYKEERDYGHSYSVDDMDSDETEMWQTVVDSCN
jgi:hypothetical protein